MFYSEIHNLSNELQILGMDIEHINLCTYVRRSVNNRE